MKSQKPIFWENMKNVLKWRLLKFILLSMVSVKLLEQLWANAQQNEQSGMAPSEDSDQPGHPPSLIRVFAVRSTVS